MTVDIEKLEALAKAAAPGPWECREAEGSSAVCWARGWVADGTESQDLADNRFIAAANPAVVLELTQTIRDLESSVAGLKTGYEAYERVNAELRAENEALRNPLLAAREFIMHEAEVRGLLDENNEVSFRHPRRQAAIAAIDAAMSKGASHD